MALILSIYLGFRWYSRLTLRKNQELQRIIAEQKNDLMKTNYNLQEKIKQNDLFQSIFVHDIKSPIRFIESNSDLLLKNWKKVDDKVVLNNLEHIHDASSKIKRFIDETVLWMKIRNGDFHPKKEHFLICKLFYEARTFHLENEKIIKGDLDIEIQCNQDFSVYSDPVFLETILRNLLSNSIKHTDSGKIVLYAIRQDYGKYRIGCKDTGKGMNEEMVNILMSDDYYGNSIRNDSFRLGYVIIKELTKILHGRIYINSEINRGTDVYIEF